jgi:hypothetical protein
MTVGRIPNVEGGIQPTLLTTTGDIMYASSASNPARLGIGTASQILAVNSGATAPEWVAAPASGGMTLLSTTTLSGATTTISSISGSYKILYGVVTGVTNATAAGKLRIAPNGSTTITTYSLVDQQAIRNEIGAYMQLTGPQLNTTHTDANNVWSFLINNYSSATGYKSVSWDGYYASATSGSPTGIIAGGGIVTNSAITSLVFSNSGGNLSAGTVLLYGVK